MRVPKIDERACEYTPVGSCRGCFAQPLYTRVVYSVAELDGAVSSRIVKIDRKRDKLEKGFLGRPICVILMNQVLLIFVFFLWILKRGSRGFD